MTNKEILEKAIQKAVEGGWKAPRGNSYGVMDDGTIFIYMANSDVKAFGIETSLREIIFNHNFAKALWGRKELFDIRIWGADIRTVYVWQYHLQQIVIAEDPIKYLGEHLNG